MLGRPDTWTIALTHAQVVDSVAPALLMETTWAIFALFLREGAGIGPHVLTAMWTGTNRSYNAAMALLMYCAMEKCMPGCESEINVTEYRGPELLLESPKGVKIRAMQELLGRRHEDMFKEGMMYFMTCNQLNEYVEGSWSNDVLERAFWAVTCGLPSLEKSKFRELELLGAAEDTDLIDWNPLILLSFFLSGMIRFSGEGDCVYQLTASMQTQVEVRAWLPKPTVNDIVTLRVLKTTDKNQF